MTVNWIINSLDSYHLLCRNLELVDGEHAQKMTTACNGV